MMLVRGPGAMRNRSRDNRQESKSRVIMMVMIIVKLLSDAEQVSRIDDVSQIRILVLRPNALTFLP